MKSYLRLLVALGLLLGLAGQAKAQPTYAFTIFDVPGASFPAYAQGINTSGQIVGHYVDADGIWHGFLFDNGSYTTLDVPVGPRPGPSCCPYISATGITTRAKSWEGTEVLTGLTAFSSIMAVTPRSPRSSRPIPGPSG
jgi:probable HAF family extracellular repeat protein